MALKKSNIPYSPTGDKDQDEVLLEPVTYLSQIEELQISPILGNALNYWLKIPIEKLEEICDIVKLMHTCGCVVDDLDDDSSLRGGIPTSHRIFGNAALVNAAGYAIFIALQRLIPINPNAIHAYTNGLIGFHKAQAREFYWANKQMCPSENDYRCMAIQKRGALFNFLLDFMRPFSECKTDFSKLIENLGLYYQIRDDYCSFKVSEYHENKKFGEHLSTGKFTFPVIHAIQNRPEGKEIMKIVKQKSNDVEVMENCIALLESAGSFAYTRSVLKDLDKEIRNEVQRLGGNPYIVKLLDSLLNWQ